MKAKNLCMYAGVCAGFASMAVAQADKPTLQKLDNAINVQPKQIAKVRRENGKIVFVTDWMDYQGGDNTRYNADARIFDCFGDNDSDGFMDDNGGCTLSTSRWFFGTAYCNMFVTADATYDEDTVIASGAGRIDFGWYFTCGGFGTEVCIVGVWTQESVPCDPDSFDYSGWLLNFGTLSCNPGGYYYTNADLGSVSGSWTIPAGGTGSHYLAFIQEVTTSGAMILATCAQTMLWGTGDGGGAPDMIGTQVTEQYDDDFNIDGSHTTSECYTYSFGLCPDPLGAMVQFWGERDAGGDPCDYADCNNDGTVNTQDFACFFNLWVPKDPAADCNNDGTVNTQDFSCFLNQWVACR